MKSSSSSARTPASDPVSAEENRVLSVVVPVYNEKRTLGPLLETVLDQPEVREVILVDDGSTDGSGERLRTFVENNDTPAEFPRIKLVAFPENRGKGTAVKTGIHHASAPFTVVQDADLEYDPSEYGRLLAPLLNGEADVVYGSRFLRRNRSGTSAWHALANRVVTGISNFFTGWKLTDMETGHKMVRTEVLQGIPLSNSRFEFEPEVTAKLARLGVRVSEVPISYEARTRGEGKKLTWIDGLRAVGRILSAFAGGGLRGDRVDPRLLRFRRRSGPVGKRFVDRVRSELWFPVVELQAGFGGLGRRLAGSGKLILTDSDPLCLRELRRSFGFLPGVEVAEWRPETDRFSAGFPAPRTVVAVDSPALLRRPEETLRNVCRSLPAAGRFVGRVPASPSNPGPRDVPSGYAPRFSRHDLGNLFKAAGFEKVRIRPFNREGQLRWRFRRTVLERGSVSGRALAITRWLHRFLPGGTSPPPTGLSWLVSARKNSNVGDLIE